MKKFYALLLPALLLALCAGAQITTPQFLAKTNADSCTTHRYKYNTYVPNIMLGKIEQNYGDGKKDTSTLTFDFFTQTTMASFVHSYASPGQYSSKAVLLYNGARVDSVTQHYFTGNCKAFVGSVYKDENSNCTLEHNDKLILSSLRIRVDSAGIPIDTISSFGSWAFMRPWNVGAGQYTFTVLNIAGDYNSSCQVGNSRTVMYGGFGSPLPAAVNFGYTCATSSASTDAIASGASLLRATTVAPSSVTARVTNMGCLDGAGTFSVKVSPKYAIVSSNISPAPVSVVGNIVTWNYSGLAHGSTKTAVVGVTPVTAVSIGDTAVNVFTASPSVPDANMVNNINIRTDTIRNSFDPNDKSVSPAGDVQAGTTLTYHINFENLGNDTAFNVHVLDTLSAHLDASSFELLSASAAVRVFELTAPNGGRILKFDFPNIRLAEKTQPLHNKGFVRFSIKAKSALASGTQIPNRAGIYFDFNPVVMTNTAMNRIGFPQSVAQLSNAPTYRVHPNPATDQLIISNTDGGLTSASVMNAMGQLVREWSLGIRENSFSIGDLPSGLYLILLKSDTESYAEKIEKR